MSYRPLHVFYFDIPNFGDAINPYLFGKVTGRTVVRCEKPSYKEHVIGVGSIANWANRFSIIIGAGLADKNDKICNLSRISLLRGPISADIARTCGNKSNFFVGDPVLALPKISSFKRNKNCDIGIIPHYVDYDKTKALMENTNSSIRLIDIRLPLKEFMHEVLSCRNIISSSLHGMIVSDAYGIPNIKVKIGDSVLGDGTKFEDYFLSVGRPEKEYTIEEILGLNHSQMLGLFEPVKIKDLTDNILKSFSVLSNNSKVNVTWR